MRYVAAYLLAALGGKPSPSQNDIEKILSSVGIEIDTEKLKKVISELDGKSVDELIEQGREKLLTVMVGAAAATAVAAPVAAPDEEKKAEEKKPAKEESESDNEDMGFGLFD